MCLLSLRKYAETPFGLEESGLLMLSQVLLKVPNTPNPLSRKPFEETITLSKSTALFSKTLFVIF
jgi:hypothetical protein